MKKYNKLNINDKVYLYDMNTKDLESGVRFCTFYINDIEDGVRKNIEISGLIFKSKDVFEENLLLFMNKYLTQFSLSDIDKYISENPKNEIAGINMNFEIIKYSCGFIPQNGSFV